MQCTTWRPVKQPIWLEPGSKEESQILDLERKIGEARRNGQPVEPLLEERRQVYEAWIARLDRELKDGNAADRAWLRQQRERAIRDYKWPDS